MPELRYLGQLGGASQANRDWARQMKTHNIEIQGPLGGANDAGQFKTNILNSRGKWLWQVGKGSQNKQTYNLPFQLQIGWGSGTSDANGVSAAVQIALNNLEFQRQLGGTRGASEASGAGPVGK